MPSSQQIKPDNLAGGQAQFPILKRFLFYNFQAGTGVGEWFLCYNAERPHSALADATPDEVYFASDRRVDKEVA